MQLIRGGLTQDALKEHKEGGKKEAQAREEELNILEAEGIYEIDEEIDPFNTVLVFIEMHAVKQTKIGILCHTCLGSKIRHFQTTAQETSLDLIRNISWLLNKNGNKRKVAFRIAKASVDEELEAALSSFNRPDDRANLYHTLTNNGVHVIAFPFLRHLNLSIYSPSELQSSEVRQRSLWWFNIVIGEGSIVKLPYDFVKTRATKIITWSSTIETFVCLDSEELRTFNLLFFSVINPDVWVLIFTVAIVLCFIYKSLKPGLNFVLTIAGIPVNSQNRNNVVLFLLWANFIGQAWNSYLSADVLGIQEFPVSSILFRRNWRTWVNKATYEIGLKQAISVFGPNIWHGKTIDEIVYDEALDPIPWNDGLAIVERLKRNKLTIFMFIERSFQSIIWRKAHFVGRHTVCKTILYHSNIRQGFYYGPRIWGLEYAQSIFRRSVESGFNVHWKSIFYRGGRLFNDIPLRPVEGFSLPDPLPIKSAVGFCLLGIFTFQLFLFLVGLVYHRQSIKSWIVHKFQVTRVNNISNFSAMGVKTSLEMLSGVKLVRLGFRGFRL